MEESHEEPAHRNPKLDPDRGRMGFLTGALREASRKPPDALELPRPTRWLYFEALGSLRHASRPDCSLLRAPRPAEDLAARIPLRFLPRRVGDRSNGHSRGDAADARSYSVRRDGSRDRLSCVPLKPAGGFSSCCL